MTTESLALFKALGAKMDYLSQRQRIIAQNIANADTPGYTPKDLTPQKFDSVLKGINGKGPGKNVHLVATNAKHMPPRGMVEPGKTKDQKDTYEVAPAGNAVVLEEQMIKSGQTVTDYNLMTSLYQKHVGLIRTALGSGGRA